MTPTLATDGEVRTHRTAPSGLRLAIAALLTSATVAALVAGFALLPPPQVRLVGFTTSLAGRTRAQRHNAVLAINALDGHVIPPGAVFSFNHAVKSWSVDQGYVKAPVSYDGELVPAFGGGVCQTSTTLYDAALRAGLPIIERHHHVFAPHYCLPGGDAAVAYPDFDLRFRNPYPFPLRLKAGAQGDRLEVEIWGAHPLPMQVAVEPHVLNTTYPGRATHSVSASELGPGRGRNPGMVGYRVVTFRTFAEPSGHVRRERLSDDSYPAMDRVIAVAEAD